MASDTNQIGYCVGSLASLILETQTAEKETSVPGQSPYPPAAESSAVSDQDVSRVRRAISWAAQNDSPTQNNSPFGKLVAYLRLTPKTERGREDRLYFLRILLEDSVLLNGIHGSTSVPLEYNGWATERLRAIETAHRMQSAPAEGSTLRD